MARARRLCGAAPLVALFAAAGVGGCSVDMFEGECRTDADCPSGHSCGGVVAWSCEPTCAIVECGVGQACVDHTFGGTSCEPGCADNDDCPAHSYCPDRVWCIFCSSEPLPQCQPGCHDDTECETGQFCSGGSCLMPCWSDTDCAPGHVCAAGVLVLALPDAAALCLSGEQCACFDCSSSAASLPGCAGVDGGSDGAAVDGGATDDAQHSAADAADARSD